MKKIIIFSLYILAIAPLFTACTKEDGPVPVDMTRFPLPVVAKVAGSDQNISASNPTAFNGKFSVALYFPNDMPPQKYDAVVIKNNDKTNVKLVQGDITSFPTEVVITGSKLAQLFNSPIVAGDRFDISVDVTTSTGQKFEAFPITGNAYASGIAAQPNSSTFVRYNAQ